MKIDILKLTLCGMKYVFQPGVQFASAISGFLAIVVISYFLDTNIDWITAIAVAATIGIMMGFAKTHKRDNKK